MRTASKRLLAILCTATVIVGPVFAARPPEGGSIAPASCAGGDFLSRLFRGFTDQVEDAGRMTCQHAGYASQPRQQQACTNNCKKAVDHWQREMPEAARAAATADRNLACTGAAGTADAAGSTRDSLTAFRAQGTNATVANETNRNRETNARTASSKFAECKNAITKGCNDVQLSSRDKKVAEAVLKACEDAEKGANQFANQKKQDGLGLGDLAKAMGLAQQAMGMAQQGQGQESPSDLAGLGAPSATSPTPASGNSQKPEILTAKLDGDKNGTQAPAIGFGNSVVPNQVASTQAGITGIGSTTGASSSPDAFGGPGGSSTGGPASGGEVGANAGSGGGAGGGGGNSTGASRPIDSIAAGGASGGDSGYEVSGGGGRPMSGLKPSKADVDSVADGSILGAADTKLDDLGREPASEGDMSAAPDGDTQNGSDSIFMRIRAKYSLLKGSGKI